jgi:hypothetical protein
LLIPRDQWGCLWNTCLMCRRNAHTRTNLQQHRIVRLGRLGAAMRWWVSLQHRGECMQFDVQPERLRCWILLFGHKLCLEEGEGRRLLGEQ